MHVDRAFLEDRYSQMSIDDIADLQEKSDRLTDEALAVLDAQIRRRGIADLVAAELARRRQEQERAAELARRREESERKPQGLVCSLLGDLIETILCFLLPWK